MTPEEITALQTSVKNLEAEKVALKVRLDASDTETKVRLAQYAEDVRKAQVKEFIGDIRALGIAPAVRDSAEFQALTQTLSGEGAKVRFTDKDAKATNVPGLEALQRFMVVVAEQAKKNAVVVIPTGETASVNDPNLVVPDAEKQRYGDNIDAESLELVAKINALITDPKGKYIHLPEAQRFRQAFMDLDAAQTTSA